MVNINTSIGVQKMTDKDRSRPMGEGYKTADQ